MSDPTPPLSATYEVPQAVEVYVVPRPRRRYWLHALLLLLTIFTTTVVGARMEYNFLNNKPALSLEDDSLSLFPVGWILEQPSRLLLGVPFAATLMLILLAHEMGHFIYCVRYGVYATLPFFIPAPTLIGTFGAFIRIRSPIRSRSALFDIGIAGPIAGFVVATAVLIPSLALSKPMPGGATVSDIQLGYPLIFLITHKIVAALAHSGTQSLSLYHVYLHPVAIAAWVGMFATALNLLPGGQLDGGHIVFALVPAAHKWISRFSVVSLLFLGLSRTGWPGWIVWAILLGLSGLRHPQVPLWTGITRSRRWLGLVALAMLILTVVPAPFRGETLNVWHWR